MIAIIGAGASGLTAAIVAARAGAKVVIFEKNTKVGKKILASGNGRCNVTNENIKTAHYHGENPSFVTYAISQFNTLTCKRFFEELGVVLVEGNKGRLYPKSGQSSSVSSVLAYECERLGVTIKLNALVQDIQSDASGFSLLVNANWLHVRAVLIATGSLAMPTLGGCESGYLFAKKLGHKIISPYASLVQLMSFEDFSSISGVKCVGGVEVYIDNKLATNAFGDILFTNYGISGSAILDISRVVSLGIEQKREVKLKLDLASEYSKEQLKKLLQSRLKYANDKGVDFWLEGFVHSKLARFITKDFHSKRAKDLSPKELNALVFALKYFFLHVKQTLGLKSAEVSAGGVDTSQINPTSLSSKLIPNLYFSGEVLDVDGDCGGFNLHWAWASGYVVGKSMIK